MLPAGEMWSVVIESPRSASTRASIDVRGRLRLRRHADEIRWLADVRRLGVPVEERAGRRRQLLPVLVAVEDALVLARVQVAADRRAHRLGHLVGARPDVAEEHRIARRGPVPSESVVRSMSRRPASAYATTSGGDARYAARTCGWMRPSKLRLPLSTAATVRSSASMRSATSFGQRAAVADARGAAVADEVEAELLEGSEQARPLEVVGDHA